VCSQCSPTCTSSSSSRASRTLGCLLARLEEDALAVSLVGMKRTFLLVGIGSFVLLFAVAGWTVDGVRWAFTPLRAA
jgi:hypothetical protein